MPRKFVNKTLEIFHNERNLSGVGICYVFLSKSEKETRGFKVSRDGVSGTLIRSQNSESDPIFLQSNKKH